MFEPEVDYVEYMDALQFAQDKLAKATKGFLSLPESWTDEQAAIYDKYSSVVTEFMRNPDCRCSGRVVESTYSGSSSYLKLKLDPAPRHPAVPKLVSITGYNHEHGNQIYKLHRRQGDKVVIHGFLEPPIWRLADFEEGEDDVANRWFKLKPAKFHKFLIQLKNELYGGNKY